MDTLTPDFSAAILSGPHWMAVGITLLASGLTVGLHYEALERMNWWLPRWKHVPPRLRILGLMVALLGLHIVEIWIFGIGIHMASHFPVLGEISGVTNIGLLDSIYLSATTYSTLGYGDLVPHGPIRFLLGTEALVGLLMITWSASFTYLEMQNYWRTR
ncbi:MAG: potassium channel family protein [Salinisphaeraceae bacterium]|nr:potassium channel family protein [Salinisphaeraceae bacterium]